MASSRYTDYQDHLNEEGSSSILHYPTKDIPICDLQERLPDNWQTKEDPITFLKDYTLTMLMEDDYEHIDVVDRFRASCNNTITYIERVENPYTWLMYQTKKESIQYPVEMNLFHGTNIKNLDSILYSNFNWRLFGSKVGNRFGQGISFSRFANYSKQYCDKNPYGDNIMIQAKVLIGNSSIGNSDTVLPEVTCDSTVSENERVWVKYDDNEFYPEYVIHFNF